MPLKVFHGIFFHVNHVNHKRSALIEYNGYKANSHFGGEQALQDIQRNDKIKVDFCNKNNLKLLLISYRDFNQIEAILESELNG